MNVGDLEYLLKQLRAAGRITDETPLKGEIEGLICEVEAIGWKDMNQAAGGVPAFVVSLKS